MGLGRASGTFSGATSTITAETALKFGSERWPNEDDRFFFFSLKMMIFLSLSCSDLSGLDLENCFFFFFFFSLRIKRSSFTS